MSKSRGLHEMGIGCSAQLEPTNPSASSKSRKIQRRRRNVHRCVIQSLSGPVKQLEHTMLWQQGIQTQSLGKNTLLQFFFFFFDEVFEKPNRFLFGTLREAVMAIGMRTSF